MNRIKISFCIPTYNRCDFLSELIDSIISQTNNRNDIEICISDNASTDNTSEMIENFRKNTNTSIVYKRNNKNIGPDKNYLAAVSLASGEYCWLFGSDDVLSDGALDEIDKYLASGCDIYLCDRYECDLSMNRISYKPWMTTGDSLYLTNDKDELIKYFNNSNSIGATFSFLGSNIVKRSSWENVSFDESFIGSAYSHVFYLLDIVTHGAKVQYINKPLVDTRLGNDFFAKDGVVKRIEIDFNGYMKFAEKFYSNDPDVKSAFLAILLREHSIFHTNILTSVYGEKEQRNRMKHNFKYSGANFLLVDFVYFIRPLYVFASKLKLEFMYKKIRRLLFK